jgi:DNA-directed RNA polymerase subunit omega
MYLEVNRMARVTVEDCIRYYPNRFEMVHLASRRARQLLTGMPCLLETEGDKPPVEALREMGEGLVSWDSLFEMDELERQRLAASSEDDAEVGAV